MVALAAAAGVAIENARLYDEASRRQRWLAATAEITALLTAGDPGIDALQTIADRAREVAGADVAWILTGQDRASLMLRATSGVEADPDAMRALPLERSLAGVVVETGIPVAVEDIATDPRALDMSQVFGWPSLGPAVVVPLRSGEQVDGALALAWSRERAEEYYTLDPALPAGFAEHADPGPADRPGPRGPSAPGDAGGPRPDRPRAARRGHPAVVRGRAGAAGDLAAGRTDPTSSPGSTRPSTTWTRPSRTSAGRSSPLASTDASHDIQAEVTRLVDRAAGTLKFRPTLQFEGPVRTLVGGDLAPDVLAVLGEALSNASRHADARSVEVLLSAGERGRAQGHRRRPRPRRVGPRVRVAQHARTGRAPGRHVRGGVGPRRGHQRHVDACPRAELGSREVAHPARADARPGCGPTPWPARARRRPAARGRRPPGTPRGDRARSARGAGPGGPRGVRRPRAAVVPSRRGCRRRR